MPWAKLQSHATYNLATSGVAHAKMSALPVRIEDLEINGPSTYGYKPLQEALAKHCGLPDNRVAAATGTSMANYLALAAALKPGDHVLIESPGYELIVAAARQIGAQVNRFDRTLESGFAIDPVAVERAMTPDTRLIVVTNLHNPSSALSSEQTITAIGDLALRHNARVLVDEVYIDAAFEEAPRSAAQLGDHFIVTSSLTKIYGLSGLRCGWVAAEPNFIHAVWRLNDLFGSIPAHMAELASVIAFGELPRLLKDVRERLEANRIALHAFFKSRADVDVVLPPFGTVVFPRLKQGSVDSLCTLLRNKYDTTVVPGSFFDAPQHFRVGIGGELAPLVEGLKRLGSALDEMRNQ